MNQTISATDIQNIVDLRNSGMTVREIAKKYNVCTATIYYNLKDHTRKVSVCQKCNKHLPGYIGNDRVIFCYHCGAKQLTAKEIVVNKLTRMFDKVKLLPSNMIDESMDTIREAIQMLENV